MTAATLTFAMALPAQAQGKVQVVRDAEIETLLRDYATPVLNAAGLKTSRVQIVLVNDQSFNAFVDGQRIFVNTGALTAAAVPNEIIGVLAHEAGHLAGGHQQRLREQIAAARTLAIVGSLLGAGAIAAGSIAGNSGGAQAGGALITAAPGIAQRSLLSYRRSEEMNADQAAARFLDATGQSMRGMLTTFERFSQSLSLSGVQVDKYQISHPLPRERIALLEELARKSRHFDAQDPASLVQRHQLMRAKIAAYSGGATAVARIFSQDRTSLAARYGDAIATDLAGNSAAALQKLDALIKEQPKNPYFREFRGEVLLKLRKGDEAIKEFSQAVKLDPAKSALIRARLGFALVSSGKPGNMSRAIEELRVSVQSEPDNFSAYRHLSQAYAQTGDIANADLIMAEGNFRAGNIQDAKVFAARALQTMPAGSPGALRANDILTIGK
ncbi:MAG: M48 family metalloprotease [Hoeflea sp.]|uniref:M48 family metalloprotease n=1 Tax=Hoeflea sp. TaxID=1940281 RepID=UPI0027305F28|nr:M48 family metalloprotease [Hoeflea sp.]MDP2119684.1 M48 family metalloprotease [Hoeflea sp.]MDP3524612.1 M48 family metalloprotease [Hoeflea sp.]